MITGTRSSDGGVLRYPSLGPLLLLPLHRGVYVALYVRIVFGKGNIEFACTAICIVLFDMQKQNPF